jgi:hypothetical protein
VDEAGQPRLGDRAGEGDLLIEPGQRGECVPQLLGEGRHGGAALLRNPRRVHGLDRHVEEQAGGIITLPEQAAQGLAQYFTVETSQGLSMLTTAAHEAHPYHVLGERLQALPPSWRL